MLPPGLWLALGVAVLLPALLYAQWRRAAAPGRLLRTRLAALSMARPAAAQEGEAGTGGRRQLIQGKLRELERQRRRSRRDTLAQLLQQSGLPVRMRDIVLGGLVLALVTGGGLWLCGMAWPVSALGSAGMGLMAPRLLLKAVVTRRQKRFVEHFADALDILVRGTRSGLPVSECLRIMARESPDPVGPEFDLLTQSERLGMNLKQALARCVDRMPVQELRFFAIVLQIQQQTGGNLAGILDKLSGVLRARKRLKDRVQALSSEAKASAAIIGSLPFFVTGVLALLSPDYIGLLFSSRFGNVMLVISCAWMTAGVLVMRKMINFGV